MSVVRVRSLLAEKSQSAKTILLAVLLELPEVPSWAHGVDHEGRAVCLVGKHRLETTEEAGPEFVRVALEAMQAGDLPNGIVAVRYAPKASEFIGEIIAGEAKEILGVGPRESGKSQAIPAALTILAEQHEAADFPLPLRCLLLNESLVSFSMKMGRSLEEEHWGNIWALRNDRREAALSLGGVEFVLADAVGATDESSAERLKTRCHVVAAEELTQSLNDSKGVEEGKYALALSSISLPTPRPVAMATCNPSDPGGWVYRRFVTPGLPGCTAITIPASDRLTPERIAHLSHAFQGDREQHARLVEGHWVALPRGQAVAEGFDANVHVSKMPMTPQSGYLLGIGWDGGHSPSAVTGQLIGGQVQVFATLNELRIGTLELIERQVRPWLREFAPWALADYGANLVHVIDPNMATPGQATITESAERIISETLGGRIIHGPVRWGPRKDAVLRVLAPRHEFGRCPLAITPGEGCALLVQVLGGKWFYPITPDGQIDRNPKKPNSPWADVGDAFAYLVDWLLGGEPMATALFHEPIKVEMDFPIS